MGNDMDWNVTDYSGSVTIAWDLRDNYSNLFEELLREDDSVQEYFDRTSGGRLVPVIDDLADCRVGNIVRPEGSRRAFYCELQSGGVIAIKGTEILSTQLVEWFADDAKRKLPNRPWSLFENFIFREQKTPLAMFMHECEKESIVGAEFQSKIYQTFGAFETAPLPLIVYKWSDSVVADYVKTLDPFLTERSRDLILPLVTTYGLGAAIYYYPHLPRRIRFNLPSKRIPLSERNKLFGGNETETCVKSVNRLIHSVAKMLAISYLPFSFSRSRGRSVFSAAECNAERRYL